MHDFKVDYSDLDGWKMECIPGCGLCCLCQPELLPEEGRSLHRSHPRQLVRKSQPHRHMAIALKKGRGSCVFLEERRCQLYEQRPVSCRQYPYRIHVGEQVKVELELSCRGVWTGEGQDAVAEAMGVVDASRERISLALRQTQPIYREFHDNCRNAGVQADPADLRAQVEGCLERFSDMDFIGELLSASYDDPEMDLREMEEKIPRHNPQELEEAAREAAMGSMASEDPMSLPAYCDEEMRWNLFMAHRGGVDWKLLTDEGDLQHLGFVQSSQVSLLPLLPDGAALLSRYVGILNRRDSFLGSVYDLVDRFGYEDHVANVYFGSLAVAVLDLLWRASMLAHFFGFEMDERGLREAIMFYDMDRLDASSIGAFI